MVRVGDAVSVLEALRECGHSVVLARGDRQRLDYAEIGTAGRAAMREAEWPQFGVSRGLRDRDGWARRWTG